MLVSSTCALPAATFAVAWSYGMTFRYRLPVPGGAAVGTAPAAIGSHVYSTYDMLPSPLISPYNFKTDAVDPFKKPGCGGTMPLAKPPITWTGALTRWGYANAA